MNGKILKALGTPGFSGLLESVSHNTDATKAATEFLRRMEFVGKKTSIEMDSSDRLDAIKADEMRQFLTEGEINGIF